MKLFKTLSLLTVLFFMCFGISKAQLGGTVTVGTGGNYTSLATLFSTIQSNGLSSNLVIEIVSDLNLGTAGAELRMWTYGTSYSVTMRPTGGDRRIYGSISGTKGLIELASVHNFIIDGRIDGTGSGRHLTLENTSTGTYAALVWLQSAGSNNGCQDITVRNCNLIGGSYTSSYTIGIAGTSTTSLSSGGYDHDDITIHDNSFKRLYYAMNIYGQSSTLTYRNEGITVTDNTIGSEVSSDRVYYYGIRIYYGADVEITGNEIFNFGTTSAYPVYLYYVDGVIFNDNVMHDFNNYGVYSYYLSGDCEFNDNMLYQSELTSYNFYYGLYLRFSSSTSYPVGDIEIKDNDIQNCRYYGLYAYYADDADISGNHIHNFNYSNSYLAGIYLYYADGAVLTKNRIHDITSTYSSGGGTYGIYHYYSNDTKLIENEIYDLSNTGNGTTYYYGVHGIRMYGSDNTAMYHNLIYLDGAFTGSATSKSSCIFFSGSAINECDFQNNIFINRMTGGTAEQYIYYLYYGQSDFDEVDYNAYDMTGATNAYFAYDDDMFQWYNTLEDFAGYNGNDANSTERYIQFKAYEDWHLDGETATDPSMNCNRKSDVMTDMDDIDRSLTTTMGLDEVRMEVGMASGGDINQYEERMCDGSSISYSFTAEVTGFADEVPRTVPPAKFNYSWFHNDAWMNPALDPNMTVEDNTMTVDNFGEDYEGWYVAVATLGDLSVTSSTSTVEMEPPADFTVEPVEYASSCEDSEPIYLNVDASGIYEGFQWQKQDGEGNWNDIEGATRDELMIPANDIENAMGFYRARFVNPKCTPVRDYSNAAEVFFYEKVKNISAMSPTKNKLQLCMGADAEFMVTADGYVTGYQWYFSEDGENWIKINTRRNETAGTDHLVLEDLEVMESGYYRCEVIGNTLCNPQSYLSNAIEIQVWPMYDIVSHPEGMVVCEGEDVELNFIGDGVLHAIHWQRDGVDINQEDNPSAGTPLLQLPELSYETSGVYRARLTIEDCRGIIDLYTKSALVYALTDPEIVKQPMTKAANEGKSLFFEVRAHVREEGEPIERFEYQWYRGTTPLVDDGRIAGAQSSILSITNVLASDYGNDYSVFVKGQCGETQSDVFSINAGPSINITLQPVDNSECETGNAQFVIDVEGNNTTSIDYQWTKDGADLMDDARITGSNSMTFSIAGLMPSDAGTYNCKVTAQPGDLMAVTDDAMIEVKDLPVITGQSDDLTVDASRSFSIEVEATGYEPMTYQWMLDGNDIAGAVDAMYSVASATVSDAGIYTCKVMNECGEVTSADIQVTVNMSGVNGVNDAVAGGFVLLGNTPNPFDFETEISFVAPYEADVKVSVTDMYGKEVAVLFNGMATSGLNKFSFNSGDYNLSSGVYYYTMTTQGYSVTRKMIIVK